MHLAAELTALWELLAVPTVALALTAAVYWLGFTRARRTRPRELPMSRCWTFMAGIATVFVAISSPVDSYADRLLLAHMTQHFLLISVAPPLIVLGYPVVPMLRGVPRPVLLRVIGPLLRNQDFQSCLHWLRAPAVDWLAMNLAFVGWHIPAAYELALRSEAVHGLEHICFLFTSLLFWWRLLEPWPAQPYRPRWFVLPYLLTADVVNTCVSAYLCFAGRVIYLSYEHVSNLFGLSPLADQVAAGTEMWVLGSTVFLIPLTILSFRMLSRPNAVGEVPPNSPNGQYAQYQPGADDRGATDAASTTSSGTPGR